MQNNTLRNTIITIIVIAGLVVLFAWPRLHDPNRALVAVWHEAGVDCLPGHQNANLHIHPILKIIVDGKSEVVPGNTGIVRSCMAETHTHDATGTIHIESVVAGKTFTLSQFFGVWGIEIDRAGYTLEMKVDGELSTEFGNLIMKDHQQIELLYTKQLSA